MAGVVLETLNTKKLIAFGVVVLLTQIAFFLIGGLISPAPNTSEQILMSKCIDRETLAGKRDKFFFLRPTASNNSCKELLDDGDIDEIVPKDIIAEQIVFIAQFPHPKEGFDLQMTRWFQQVLAVLMLDIKHVTDFEVQENALITFDVRLGYRNREDADADWKEIARSNETRPLTCKLDPRHVNPVGDNQIPQHSGHFYYDCEVLPLFTLGNCHHDSYLVNLRIPLDKTMNNDIGSLQDVWMIEIHQNGGFTKVWFALKTSVFPVTLAALVFFWKRIMELDRPPNLMERTIFALGIVLTIFNCPIEWLSLKYNISFWLVLSDVRQGAFYATLACFWLVFTGEHLMDSAHGPKSAASGYLGINSYYWPKLLLVGGCCTALTIFELAERGVQLHNPFYSMWSHPSATRIGYTTMVIGGLCAAVYFCYLAFLVARAMWQIVTKRRLLSSLNADQRVYYSGLIYRFTALLLYTIICAALTVIFFIFSQANEEQWKWGSHSLEYTSAFITGVYGMWNAYVITILCLYAPSHKFRSTSGQAMLEHLIISDAATASDAVQFNVDLVGGRQAEGEEEPVEVIELGSLNCSKSGLSFLRKTAQE